MQKNRKAIVSSLLVFCVPVLVATFAAAQNAAKDVEAEGIIKSKTGETLIVTNPEKQTTTTVLLTNDTKVRQLKIFSEKHVTADVLIPGLKISVEGTSDDQGRVVAKKIDFDSGDMETAQMIQAGLHPTAEEVAANKQQTEQNKQQIEQNTRDTEANTNRLSQFGEYEEKGSATVTFPVNSSNISAQDKEALTKLAHDVVNLKGYVIEVRGYADSRGAATMNEKLSEDRAQAVADYLVEDCNVPMRHVITPAALGETHAVASNETAAGRAENRRAVVKVLVNKGIAGP
jgi:outer membrane protein OmpA-like peptidoglycan-associated protein